MNVSLILIGLALVLLFISPIFGLVLFSPARARALKRAEAHEDAVAVQVAYLRVRHPEMVAGSRYDRHPAYVMLAIIHGVYGLIVTFVAAPYAAFGSNVLGTRYTLGISLLIGSVLMLTGSILGSSIAGRCIGTWVCNNMVSAMLGDDVRVPYLLAVAGLFSTGISMAFYGYTVIGSVGMIRMLTSLGGITAIGVGGLCVVLIPKFISQTRKYLDARALLIEEALARIERADS